MTVVLGDADHLLGEPVIGKPQEGQFYVYNGAAFVPTDAVEQHQIEDLREDTDIATRIAGQAMEKSVETRTFLDELIRDNRIEIPVVEKALLQSLRQNIQLLFLRESKAANIGSGATVDGFYDVFRDEGGIDQELSCARHDSDPGMFTPIDKIYGLNRIISMNSSSEIQMENVQGEAVYWKQDDESEGHFEGEACSFNAGILVDRGGGKVGFPATGHGLSDGGLVRFYGFSNPSYNSIHFVDASSTLDEIVISATFSQEEITTTCGYRKVLSTGPSGDCAHIEEGMIIELSSETRNIVWIDSVTNGAGFAKIGLDLAASSQMIVRISGLKYNSEGVTVASGSDFHGHRNASTTDSIPPQTNSDNVHYSSQTTLYEAYKLFNDEFGIYRRWLTSINNTTGWVTYNFGVDRKIINKYRWRTFETDSNAVPAAWRLEASNDNVNWTALHSASNSVQTANTWIPVEAPGYFTFYNSVPYQYYRFFVTQNCGHPQYLCLDEIELIEASPDVFPQNVMVFYTKPGFLPDTNNWDSIESVDISELKPGSTHIFHAFSFNSGLAWSIFRNSVWRQIVVFESGVWKHMGADDLWQSLESDDLTMALKRAFNIPSNQMTASEAGNMSESDWSGEGGWSADTSVIQFAVGLQGDGQERPTIQNINIQYSTKPMDLVLTSAPIPIDATSERIYAGLLVKNKHDSLRLYVSAGDAVSWTDFGTLKRKATLGDGIDFYVTNEIEIHESSQARIIANCENSHGLEIHGWALNWGPA